MAFGQHPQHDSALKNPVIASEITELDQLAHTAVAGQTTDLQVDEHRHTVRRKTDDHTCPQP